MTNFKKNLIAVAKFIYVSSILFLIIGSVSYAITGVSWPKKTGDPLTAMTVNELRAWGVNGATFTNDVDAVQNPIYHMGNVGIGTDNPAVKLDVNGGASFKENIFLGDDSSGSHIYMQNAQRQWDIYSDNAPDALRFWDNTAGLDVFVLKAGGNVGVGTNDPGTKLDVNGKIRMQSQTVATDENDVVATKGYVDNKSGSWPAGSYCIIKNGACPADFGEKTLSRIIATPSAQTTDTQSAGDSSFGVITSANVHYNGFTAVFKFCCK